MKLKNKELYENCMCSSLHICLSVYSGRHKVMHLVFYLMGITMTSLESLNIVSHILLVATLSLEEWQICN